MSKKIISGEVYLHNMYLEELPEFLADIDKVMGDMSIDGNSLTNLKNCPRIINGYFTARKSNLRSLEGGPREIKYDFDISRNLLTNLEHSPDIVYGIYDCKRNSNLKSLKGCTPRLESFDASGCDLRDLVGGPTEIVRFDYNVMAYYVVAHNRNLTSLYGAPTVIPGNFSAFGCGLKDLKGAPKIIEFTFNVGENPLESLEGCPKKVGGNFICYPQDSYKDESLQTFTEEQIRAVCDVRGDVIVKRDSIDVDI